MALLHVRVRDVTKARVQHEAERLGLSMTDYVRLAIEEKLDPKR